MAPDKHSNGSLDLLSMVETLVSTINLDEYLKKLSQTAEEILQSEVSSVLLLTDDKKNLFCKVASGKAAPMMKKATIPVGSGIAGWVAANGKPELVTDAHQDKRFAHLFDHVSGFVTRSLICVPIVFRGETVGVLEVINRRDGPYTEEHVRTLAGLANLASSAIATARSTQEQQNFFSHSLELLGGMIEVVKPHLQGHPIRCVRLACAVGKAMELDDYDYRMLYYASYLHDIGYLALHNVDVAARLGFSQPREEHHPLAAVKMLEGITVLDGTLPIIQHHHESYDGTGYPMKLKGDQIPLGARILYLVENLEDLRMKGGIKGEGLAARAVKEATVGSGSRYDPKVAEVAVEILQNYQDAW